jgi:tetratricopeptide (TPR) repeat protein
LGLVYADRGRHDEAIAAYKKAVELGLESGRVYGSLAAALQKLGRETEAAEHLARARELMDQEDAYTKACIEAISGNVEAALDYLAEALAGMPGLRAWARHDPDLASLRGQPRFEALVGGATEG